MKSKNSEAKHGKGPTIGYWLLTKPGGHKPLTKRDRQLALLAAEGRSQQFLGHDTTAQGGPSGMAVRTVCGACALGCL